MKNIVLVGFMGTGKTAVSKALSESLSAKYVSTDDLIEEKENTSISDIFLAHGEEYFRKVEKEVIKQVSLMEDVVIDAGGGAIINPENVKSLKKKGIIVCLWAEPRVILERTKKKGHRPLLKVKNPLERIKDLLEKRKSFYERADYHISTSRMSIDRVVREIKSMLKVSGYEDQCN